MRGVRAQQIDRLYTRTAFLYLLLFIGSIILTFSSCREKPETVIEFFEYPLSEREIYQNSLALDSLIPLSTKQDWLENANHGLQDSVFISTPYREQFRNSSKSLGVRLNAVLGEQLVVIREPENLLIDIWKSDSTSNKIQVYTPIEESDTLIYPIDKNGEYLIRIQSKLGDTISPVITILTQPQNIMPVVGADNEDAWSRFGDPRDAGRRVHEGIDVFKRRGTLILSASPGQVTVVKNEGLGGKQAWVQDERLPIRHYYAHLDSVYVLQDQLVARGDTIGTVGNTGNARTTRPHLHYGMYMNGIAVDPFPFVGTQRTVRRFRMAPSPLPTIVTPDLTWRLRLMPSGRSLLVLEGQPNAELKVIGWTNGWWHVSTSSGKTGFVFDDGHFSTIM